MSDPAEKYRDKVSPQHRLAMDSLALARELMQPHYDHLKSVIDAERHSHSIGPFVDPTLYRDMIQSRSFQQQLKVIRAAIRFLDEIGDAERSQGS